MCFIWSFVQQKWKHEERKVDGEGDRNGTEGLALMVLGKAETVEEEASEEEVAEELIEEEAVEEGC